MKFNKLLILLVLSTNISFADNMGDANEPNVKYKYKVGEVVMINLKGTKYNGRCDAMGTIWRLAGGSYQIKGVACKWGKDDSFTVDDEDIIDVFVEEDFKTGGRYGKNIIVKKVLLFFRDKTKDYLPCMRNSLDDETKEKLCEKNKYKFY